MTEPPRDQSQLADVEVEQALLAAVLAENRCYDLVTETVQAADFWHQVHGRIFEACGTLISRGEAANAVTLNRFFKDEAELAEVGGADYLAELQGNVVSLTNAPQYAETLRDLRIRRQAVTAGEFLVEKALALDVGGDARQLLEGHVAEIDLIVGGADQRRGLAPVAEQATEVVADIAEGVARRRGGGTAGLSTGLPSLDALLCGGLRQGRLHVLGGAPSMGKAQPLDALVLTPEGWCPIDELSDGQIVTAADGTPTEVTNIFPQGMKDIYEIEFVDGRRARCCDEHLWLVHERRWPREGKVVNTRYLRRALGFKSNRGRLSVPRAAPWRSEPNYLSIDPYVLGVLIGDGSLPKTGTPRFTSADPFIASEVQRRLSRYLKVNKKSGPYDYSIVDIDGPNRKGHQGMMPNPLTIELELLGLAGCTAATKRIPSQYLKASLESRLELIRGLMDTDGTVERRTGTPYISVSNKNLAKDIQELMWSIGAVARITKKKPFYYRNGEKRLCRISYRVNIRHPRPRDLFRLKRKRDLAPISYRYAENLRLVIKEIRHIGRAECACIQIDHVDQLYVTNDFIPTHNTALALAIAEAVARRDGPVALFSLEMARAEVLTRIACATADIPVSRALQGNLSDAELEGLRRAAGALGTLHLHVDQGASVTPAAIRSRARRLKRSPGLRLVVVDYLQLMTDPDVRRRENRTGEVTAITRALKLLAADLEVPVILVSQLSREHAGRDNRRPRLSDLRESGSIEQDADVVLFCYREAYYMEREGPSTDKPRRGEKRVDENEWRADLEAARTKCEVICAKQRSGPLGTVVLRFDAPLIKFSERDDSPPPQEEIAF